MVENIASSSGGAIHCLDCGAAVLFGLHVEGNKALDGTGGGISWESSDSNTMGTLAGAACGGDTSSYLLVAA